MGQTSNKNKSIIDETKRSPVLSLFSHVPCLLSLVLLPLAGFISMLGQVAVLRELSVAFYGIELIYILSIGIWLIGTATGASFGRRNKVPNERNVLQIFFFSAILLVANIVFIRGIRQIFQGVPGGFLPFFTQILAMAIALIPLSFSMGFLFQLTAKLFIAKEGTLAMAYAIESAGGIAGGLASTLFLFLGVQNFSIAIICSVITLGIISYYSWVYYSEEYPSRKDKLILQKFIFSAGLIALLFLLIFSSSLDRWMTSWNNPFLTESKDTPYSRVTITSFDNQFSVFEDGSLSYDTESIEAEEHIQLSTLHASKLDNVLVLGNGFCGIISELLKLPVKKIDYVEINKDLLSMLEKYLPESMSAALKDKRVNVIYGDPRKYLNDNKRNYDAIILGMPEPTSSQSNRFYTAEFFKECSKNISKGGILTFKIRSAENFWTPQLEIRNKSIYNALRSVFNNIIVLPGTANIFIASGAHLTHDPSKLTLRFNERKPETKLVSPEYIKYIYTNDRFSDIAKTLSDNNATASSGINSDLKPACYSYTLSIWLSKFFTGMVGQEGYLSQINSLTKSAVFWIVLIITAGIIISLRRLHSLRRFILVALAGFIGMIVETIIILNYQSKSGVLYRDIGILLMTFMAGLTIGSYIVNRVLTYGKSADKVFAKENTQHSNVVKHNPLIINKKYIYFGLALLTCFAVLNILVYYLIKFDLAGSLPISSFLLITDGIFVAAVFAFASFNRSGQSQASMIPLYSADLIGGCIGSIAASLVLIPVYGTLETSLIMAAAAICTLVFLN